MTETEQTAYHEAAHAVIFWHVRMPFTEVSVIPHDDSLGRVGVGVVLRDVREDRVSTKVRLWVERQIMCYLAGPIMDEILGQTVEDSSDLHASVDLAERVTGSLAEMQALVSWLWERTKNTLTTLLNRLALQAVAQALSQHRRLTARTARKIMRPVVQDGPWCKPTWKGELEAMPGTWPE